MNSHRARGSQSSLVICLQKKFPDPSDPPDPFFWDPKSRWRPNAPNPYRRGEDQGRSGSDVGAAALSPPPPPPKVVAQTPRWCIGKHLRLFHESQSQVHLIVQGGVAGRVIVNRECGCPNVRLRS